MDGYWWLLIGIGTTAVLTFISKMIMAKYGIKDKDSEAIRAIKKNCVEKHKDTDHQIDKLVKSSKRNDKGMSVMLQTHHAVLTTLKKGNANGEIDDALELFDDSFKQEYYIK